MAPAAAGPPRHQSVNRSRSRRRPPCSDAEMTSHCVKRFQANLSNFSIDHILNVAGGKESSKDVAFAKEVAAENKEFEWLSCTRYRPPRLPRPGKREGIQRRKSGRNPRIPFSSSQVAFLEAKFLRTPYLSGAEVTKLAAYLKLSETRVKIWFQNRRARERREKESKSKAEENPGNPEGRPTGSPPPDLPVCFSLAGSAAHSAPLGYLQIVAPLDLSERRLVYTHQEPLTLFK